MTIEEKTKGKTWIKATIEERDLLSVFMYGESGLYSTAITWNDLMPVVEKISKIRCASKSDVDFDTFFPRTFGMLSPEGRKPMVRINRFQVFEADTLIDATYLAVIDFIKWYNTTITDKTV